MTNTTETTISTLTAEVHVMKVGNRQITQSVAKQLDTARYSEIEPFGRVKFSGDNPTDSSGLLRVIGRHKTTGALVTASRGRPRKCPLVDTSSLPLEARPVYVMDHEPITKTSLITVGVRDRTVQFAARGVRVRLQGRPYIKPGGGFATEERGTGWYLGDAAEEIVKVADEAVAAHDQQVEEYEEIKALPLIVLAGLR